MSIIGRTLMVVAAAAVFSSWPMRLLTHSTAASLAQVGVGALALVVGLGLYIQSHDRAA